MVTMSIRIYRLLARAFTIIPLACIANGQSPPMVPTQAPPASVSQAQTEIRTARARYFDEYSTPDEGKLEERDPDAPAGFVSHYPAPKGELPAELSDIIVLGSILNYQAYLSQNHGAIYTELTVGIQHVYSIADKQPDPGAQLVILMDGGALRLPNGRVIRQLSLGSGNAFQANGRYLFFLKYVPALQAYGCVKAWGLEDGKATAIASDDLCRITHKTSVYNGMSEALFLDAVRSMKAGTVNR